MELTYHNIFSNTELIAFYDRYYSFKSLSSKGYFYLLIATNNTYREKYIYLALIILRKTSALQNKQV